MLVFLDTEFTGFMSPELISLALVADGGPELYVELDYRREVCSKFVKDVVEPLLHGYPIQVPRLTAAARVLAWFDELPEPPIIVTDFETDKDLLVDLVDGQLELKFMTHMELLTCFPLEDMIERLKIYKAAKAEFFMGKTPHHALVDARCFAYAMNKAVMKN